MKICITTKGHEIIKTVDDIADFTALFYDFREDYFGDAFKDMLNRSFLFLPSCYETYAPSRVLECCDKDEYHGRFDEWYFNTLRTAWDDLERDGFVTIGDIEMELIEGDE